MIREWTKTVTGETVIGQSGARTRDVQDDTDPETTLYPTEPRSNVRCGEYLFGTFECL